MLAGARPPGSSMLSGHNKKLNVLSLSRVCSWLADCCDERDELLAARNCRTAALGCLSEVFGQEHAAVVAARAQCQDQKRYEDEFVRKRMEADDFVKL